MENKTDEFKNEPDEKAPTNKFYCAGAKLKFEDTGEPYCDYKAPRRWMGPCPKCKHWYRCLEIRSNSSSVTSSAQLIAKRRSPPFSTTIPFLDEVLAAEGGKGMYEDSCILLGGSRASGKTSMLLLAANGVAKDEKHQVVFASGEDGKEQITRYMDRLGINNPNIRVMAIPEGSDIELIKSTAEDVKAKLIIVDSAQSVFFDDVDGDAGSPAQIKALANSLNDFVKIKKIPIILICQLNKGQTDFAGSGSLQYLVDALVIILNLEEKDEYDEVIPETKGMRKLIIDGKNRLGPNDVTAMFKVTGKGLEAVKTKKRSRIWSPEKEEEEPPKKKSKLRLVVDPTES